MITKRTRAIRRISVTNLFGMYDYDLAISGDTSKTEKIFILYGDNGSGKTTILKLAFHLLAPEDNKSHKSTAAKIPFEHFEIKFQDNTKVYAVRPKGQLTGSFSMGIKSPSQKKKTVEFIADKDNVIRSVSKKHDETVREFLNALSKLDISLYMLSDDRTIHFAGGEHRVPLPYDIESNNEWIYSEAEFTAKIQRRSQTDPETTAQYLLKNSIERAEKWIQSKAMSDSLIGESSIATLYNEILHRIVSQSRDNSLDSTPTKKSIEERVKKLESKYKEFAQYRLLPKFSGKEILVAVSSVPPRDERIMMSVLDPYLKSLQKKLEAMTEVYRRVDSFVSIINRFLVNKELVFNLHSGMAIRANDGTLLEPAMLSSGERHLFLLFCNSFVAEDRPSILMIDEPEISLNIKWQRRLLDSLLECIGDSPVQYLFATHSIELLAQHRGQVAKLENIRGG